MTAPGITVTSLASPPPVTTASDTAPWFVTGMTQRGRTDQPISVTSIGEVTQKLGARAGYSALWDALDLFFRDGGSQAYVARIVGSGAAVATVALKDGASTPVTTLNVSANSVGTWGNGAAGGLSVAVVTGSVTGTYQLVISLGGAVVETSPNLSTPADAVAWSAVSNYVTITDAHSATVAPQNNPAVAAAAPLAGGLDDNASITESNWTAALTLFAPDMGPGQVSAPGRTTDAAHIALLAHAAANNRIALMDGVDTATAATLTAAAQAVVAAGGDPSRGAIFAPWVLVPGIATGGPVPAAPRSVAPSALAAAAIARTDAATQNPNVAAAGTPEGVSSYAIGVSQTYSDSDRGLLNSVGVDVIRNIAGVVQVYGFRTLSNDPNWVQLNWARLRMAITNDATQIAAAISEFSQLDGKGQMLGRLNGHLAGMLQAYWQRGALYGNVATDAFAVDTSAAVNTPATLAAGQVIAVISIRRTPMAEFTQIEIVNVPITQAV